MHNSSNELTTRYRFPKSTRLLNAGDYSRVFDGVDFRVSSHHFLLLVKSNSSSSSRLGLIIAKKHVKLAVQRNRLKRLARESFRLHLPKFENYDLVLLAKKEAGTLTNSECSQEMDFLWRKFKRKAKS